MKFGLALVALLLISSCTTLATTSSYRRSEWGGWSHKEHNCQNTRHEILAARSLKPVTFSKKGCKVSEGAWDDYYYPETLSKTSDVDIDHLVPLKHAHENGGSHWNSAEKSKFANDPENLVITHKSYNRMKGAKTISEWLPVNKAYACRYMKDWFHIKAKYKLLVLDSELQTFKIANCPK